MDIYSARTAYLDELGERRATIINLLVTESCFSRLLHPFRTMRYHGELSRLDKIDEHMSIYDARLTEAKEKVRIFGNGSVKHNQVLKEAEEISQEIGEFIENNKIESRARIKVKSRKNR